MDSLIQVEDIDLPWHKTENRTFAGKPPETIDEAIQFLQSVGNPDYSAYGWIIEHHLIIREDSNVSQKVHNHRQRKSSIYQTLKHFTIDELKEAIVNLKLLHM